MERSALAGILNTAFGGTASCVANKGSRGTLNEGQEELCEFFFNNGRPNFQATPGTCDDGGYPLCTDKSRPACASKPGTTTTQPSSLGSLFCADGSTPVCKDKRPPLCSDGRPVPIFGQDQGKGSVFSDASCANFCRLNTGLCESKQDSTDLYKLMIPPMMMVPPSSSESGKPKTGTEAGKKAGAEAAKAAFRRTDTAFRKVFEDGNVVV
jgi:hypothetical protein